MRFGAFVQLGLSIAEVNLFSHPALPAFPSSSLKRKELSSVSESPIAGHVPMCNEVGVSSTWVQSTEAALMLLPFPIV